MARLKNFSAIVALAGLMLLSWCHVLFGLTTGTGPLRADLHARASQLQHEDKESEALQIYEQILQRQADDYLALLNAALLHLRQGWLYGTEKQKKEHYLKLHDYASKAVRLKPNEYQARLLYSIGKAKIAGYASAGEQVRIVRELDQELNALLRENNDPDSVYILSWLNFKVGQIGSLKKMLANALFGGLPENLTTAKAILLMEKAIQLRPGYSIYYYDLAIFYQRLARLEKARLLFEKVLSMPSRKPEEIIYKERAKRKLQEIAGKKQRNGFHSSSAANQASER